jgi:hypothetical protein
LEQSDNVANGATFNGAHRARVDAREAGRAVVPHPGYNAADYNRLTRAMGADLRDMAAGSAHNQSPTGRRAAIDAFDRAEREFGPLAKQNDILHKLIESRGEGAIATLLNAGKETGGNTALLAQLRRTMNTQDFQVIGGQLLHELGHSPATSEFSLGRFVTNWNKTSPRARGILFSPQHQANIEDIVGMGAHIKSALRESNTSHTANALILIDIARDAIEAGIAVGAGVLSGASVMASGAAAAPALLFSHWLSGPATSSSMAAWSRARAGMLNNPTPARVAMFNIATRNLSHNLGIPMEVILKKLAESGHGGRAEDEQVETPGKNEPFKNPSKVQQ